MAEITIGLPDCPRVRIYADFLKKRDYALCGLEEKASIFLICPDHAEDSAVAAAALAFDGPKLVLGAKPQGWPNTQTIRMPALPIDVEGRIRELLTTGTSSAPHRVLLVEDDPAAALSLGAALKSAGLGVSVCTGFAELASALALRPDFIVMDLNLPGITGDQLGEMVRAQNIPMAIVSSESRERLEAARLKTGALAAFPKNTRLSEISDFIQRHLSRA